MLASTADPSKAADLKSRIWACLSWKLVIDVASLEREIYFTQMKNTVVIPEQKTPYFTLPSHRITWEQDLAHLKKSLSYEDLETFLHLHDLASTHPRQARKKVEIFRKRYPSHPEILNLLTYLYLFFRKVRKANHLIKENYAKNPNYLFAKINFADLCLRKKQSQKIPEIFNHQWSLQALYPERKIFHVSEFRGFMTLMGFYQIALGNRDAAEGYYYLAKHITPNHPSVKILAKKLYSIPFYKRGLFKIFFKK